MFCCSGHYLYNFAAVVIELEEVKNTYMFLRGKGAAFASAVSRALKTRKKIINSVQLEKKKVGRLSPSRL